MSTIVVSGSYNNRLYKITYISQEYNSHYELFVFDKNQDQFVQQGSIYSSVKEVEQHLEDLYGTHN